MTVVSFGGETSDATGAFTKVAGIKRLEVLNFSRARSFWNVSLLNFGFTIALNLMTSKSPLSSGIWLLWYEGRGGETKA